MDFASESLAIIHANARLKAKLSQDYMAQALGVNKKTVISWEKGLSSPSVSKSFQWFRICSVNPLPQYLKIVTGESVRELKNASDEHIDAEILKLIEILPPNIKRALLFLFLGEHDSSPNAIIQLMLAYLHTPLASRATQAITSANMYLLEKEVGNDPYPGSIQPDIDVLQAEINKARAKILHEVTRRKE